MQTTLLGIAIALILALVTALVGPLFVDWNAHRAFFEAEASRLTGLPVHVAGAIDVSVLPTPSITLRAIEIGQPDDESRLRAGALAFALGLGPLMRGELRAVEVRLVGPELSLKLNREGGLEWPGMAMGFDGAALSIERLNIEEGRAILVDATSGTRAVLEKLSFKGEVRSLAGPYRGEGEFVTADQRYGYRISTSRLGDDGIKLRLGVDAFERPLTIEADGMLAFEHGAPRFEGNLTLSRPVGAAQASGKALVSEPWRAVSKIKVTAANALFEQVEFQYGPDERMVKLNGAAEVKFGEQPRLQGVLSARHIDLDRLIAKPELMRQLPFAAIKAFAEMFSGMLQPSMPTQLTVNVDAVTLGGATLQTVSGELSTRGLGWQLERLDFRAPGFTRVNATGRLESAARGLGFAGVANVNATDSMTLLAWLTGRSNPARGPIQTLSAGGNVTLTSDRIGVEELKAQFDRATLKGRLDYAWSIGDHPSHLVAELSAGEIDIDTWLQVAETMFAGLELERPREMALKLDVERARLAGFEMRKATVQLKLDADKLDLQRLSMDEFGGATLEASGRIEALSSSPRGNIKLDLDARDLSGVLALADKIAPPVVEPLRRLAGRQSAAKLSANFGVESSSPGAITKRVTAKIGLEGQVGTFRVKLIAGASADPGAFARADLGALAAANVRFESQIDTQDGAALLAVMGLDRMTAPEKRPGRLKFNGSGPLNQEIRIDGRLTAGLLDITGRGNASLSIGQPASAKFTQILGTVGRNNVQGRLTVTFGLPVHVDGVIEAERLDVQAAIAPIIGMSLDQMKPVEAGGESWSLEPFTQNASKLTGRIEFKVARAVLNEKLFAKSLRGVLQFGPSRVAFEIRDSELAGGRLAGQLAFFSSAEGLSALSYVELSGAEMSVLIPAEGRSPIAGNLSLQATIEGAGLSPAAFIGSLHGNGTISLENARFAGLNPRVFDALTRAVDLGIRADNKQIREFVATLLQHGHLAVKRAQGKIAFVGGQARLTEPRVEADGADLAVTAAINLSDATLDATLALSGPTAAGVAGRPAVSVSLKGPLTTPTYTFNADTLAGWLALRSVEQQSKRLETIEATRRAAMVQPLPLLQAAPAGRAVEEDDANTPRTQAAAEPGPIVPDTTGGVLGIIQAPPLPPPITIEPEIKGSERRAAPTGAGRMP